MSDPALARRRRLARDALLADEAASEAQARGIAVVAVDGSRDADAVADEVAARFGPFLAAS